MLGFPVVFYVKNKHEFNFISGFGENLKLLAGNNGKGSTIVGQACCVSHKRQPPPSTSKEEKLADGIFKNAAVGGITRSAFSTTNFISHGNFSQIKYFRRRRNSSFINLNCSKSIKMLTKIIPQFRRFPLKARSLVAMYGSDSGKAGAINEAGGSFGKKEQAQEAQYFNKLQQEQLKKLKQHVQDEVAHHEAEIKRHQEAIAKQKKLQQDLEK